MKYQIKMLSSARGVDDGKIHSEHFEKGETAEVGESLAKAFEGMGVCKILGEAAIEAAASDPEPEEPPTDLTKMNKAQLLETAAAKGVVVDETASKKDIIAAIEAAAS